jgi:hypothetical protein
LHFTRTNEVGGGSRAEQEPDGFHEDRLSCPGLAGENVEAWLELDLNRLNHSEVADTKQA